ncbi:hypothetical protein GWI33_002753 [Rhynchophorus ferrugineus]|uniref:FLYWCH-type domain-containing protein n=1 Tax=Rhynchophorus ferrugineus TaxID=354439 RepID=A0A834MHG4_RHYFE|nr:hypothetical protein GWI33_002753 [Rhynchophorus ferrugineus]
MQCGTLYFWQRSRGLKSDMKCPCKVIINEETNILRKAKNHNHPPNENRIRKLSNDEF